MFQRLRSLLAVCLLLPAALGAAEPSTAAATATPTPLPTLLGKLDLPFDYRVESRTLSFSSSLGLWVFQDIVLFPNQGAWAGKEIRVRAGYGTPDRIESGVVQNWVRSEAEKAAADPKTTLVKPVELAGFAFNLIEQVHDFDGKPTRVTRLSGSINGARVSIDVNKPDDDSLDGALQAAVLAVQLDFVSMMRLRGQFDRERERATKDERMHSPIGLLSPPSGTVPRLTAASVVRDGDGKVQSVAHTYGFYRMGFWSEQRMALFVTCDQRGDEPKRREDALTPFDGENSKVAVSSTSEGEPIGGLQATLVLGERAPTEFVGATDVSRWVAFADKDIYVAQIERINGRPLEQNIVKQMKEMKFACALDTELGGTTAPKATASAQPATPEAKK